MNNFFNALVALRNANVSVLNSDGSFKKLYYLIGELEDSLTGSSKTRASAFQSLASFVGKFSRFHQDPNEKWKYLITETFLRYRICEPKVPMEAWLNLYPDQRMNDIHRMAFIRFLDIAQQVEYEDLEQHSQDFTDDNSESLDKFFKELEMITV